MPCSTKRLASNVRPKTLRDRGAGRIIGRPFRSRPVSIATSRRPLSEFDLIDKYFKRASTRTDVVLGNGDDAAVLEVPSTHRLVAAVDTIVEGVHFPIGTAAEAIGHRALAVNLSDAAAMGAEPAWATLSLSLPKADEVWLRG